MCNLFGHASSPAQPSKEIAIPPSSQKQREPRPRLGEILIYEPDRRQGILYSLREGRTLPFKLSDSPGLPSDVLRPGIQVHFFTSSTESGEQVAVQLTLEPVASLDARLRYVAKRAAKRKGRTAESVQVPTGEDTESSASFLDDIAFMGAGLSSVSARGRRGLGGGKRERDRMADDLSSDEEPGSDEGEAESSGEDKSTIQGEMDVGAEESSVALDEAEDDSAQAEA